MSDDTETLAEVLAAHEGYEWWPMTREFICTCETSIGRDYPDRAHRTHVAAVLAARIVQARAGEGALQYPSADAILTRAGHLGTALTERESDLIISAIALDRAALTDTAGDPT